MKKHVFLSLILVGMFILAACQPAAEPVAASEEAAPEEASPEEAMEGEVMNVAENDTPLVIATHN